MKKTAKKVLASILALTMSLGTAASLSSCDLFNFGTGFKLTSIVVTNSSVDTQYDVGETVSFDGIVIKAKFNDGTEQNVALSDCKVYLGTEDITNNLSKITETAGAKTVTIEYEGQKATLTINVSVVDNGGGFVLEFSAPATYISYKNETTSAGKSAYGQEDYEAEFMTGDAEAKDYLVGDDNNFKFAPRLSYLDNNDQSQAPSVYETSTAIKYDGNDLEAKAGAEEGTVEYYDGTTLYVTAYTATNEYKFAEAAIGGQFELSILPGEIYEWSGSAVTAIVNVVDGYNIYEAKQLAVIDNGEYQPKRWARETGAYFWSDIKEANGLTGINPASIVLQNDIKVTAEDIPSYFYYTLDQEVEYFNGAGEAVKGSSTFLRETTDNRDDSAYTDILVHYMNEGESFAIHGNYHTLNLSEVPLVCSFENTQEESYGTDGSNAIFLQTKGVVEGATNPGDFEVENLHVLGNANINSLKDSAGNPVYAGGITFNKASRVDVEYNNLLVHATLTPFLPEFESNAVIKNTKAYDSFNSAIFAYCGVNLSIENSNLERAGGPLIIASQKDSGTDTAGLNAPYITADENSILKNYVTGGEFWFVSKGVNTLVSQIAALNQVYNMFGRSLTKMIDGQNKFNLICVLMDNTGVPTDYQTQGFFSYGGSTLDRINNDPVNHLIGYQTHQVLAGAGAIGAMGMTLNAGAGFTYMEASGSPNMDSLYASATEFAMANYTAINFGGFGLYFESFLMA